jgi:hypothetical protein
MHVKLSKTVRKTEKLPCFVEFQTVRDGWERLEFTGSTLPASARLRRRSTTLA